MVCVCVGAVTPVKNPLDAVCYAQKQVWVLTLLELHAAVVPVSVLQPPLTWSHVKALISVSCTLFNQMSAFAVITLILVIQLSSF